MPAHAATPEMASPLTVIQQLFDASKRGEGAFDPVTHFKGALEGRWEHIPLLNDAARADEIAPGSLVRFRCMVQNVYNPEFYVAEYALTNPHTGERTLACGYFADTIKSVPGFTADLSGPSAVTQERLPLHCVSIPGESRWVKDALKGPASVSGKAASATPAASHNKRPLEDGDEEMTEEEQMECEATSASSGVAKKSRAAQPSERDAASTGGDAPMLGGHAAIVKVYDPSAEDSLKVNEIVEFVGIMTVDAVITDFPAGKGDDAEDAFTNAGPPPASVAPRIHALGHRRLTPWSPALDSIPPEVRARRLQEGRTRAPAARELVVRRLASALGGDADAAEWTLLSTLSKISSRAGGLIVGKLSLGVSGFPVGGQGVGAPLAEVLESFLPQISYLALSTKSLNKTSYVPKKDYDTERLSHTCLQLPAGTRLVIDESTMSTGQLNDTGCKNLMALQALVTQQSIPFDFSFYNVDFPTDVPVIVTSQAKPLVPVDCQYRLPADCQAVSHADSLSPEEYEACRLYLNDAYAANVDITDEVCNLAEQHFVAARQVNSKISQDDLHRWLTVARLLTASYLETSVSPVRWAQMVDMEARRVASLPPAAAPVSAGGPMETVTE